MKMNSLVDRQAIEALYAASQAGVRIDLIVRGICCLRPGVPGLSEGIRVVSLLGRFLEHERVFQFTDVDGTRTYMGSADLMPRNLDARVEVVTPVEDAHAAHEVDVVLAACLHDNRACWELQPDGTWKRRHAAEGEPERSAQDELMARALAAAERAEQATLADETLERVVRRRGRRPGPESVMTGERVAVVDVGSNSIRLLVSDVVDEHPTFVHTDKVMARLGQSLGARGPHRRPQDRRGRRHRRALRRGRPPLRRARHPRDRHLGDARGRERRRARRSTCSRPPASSSR